MDSTWTSRRTRPASTKSRTRRRTEKKLERRATGDSGDVPPGTCSLSGRRCQRRRMIGLVKTLLLLFVAVAVFASVWTLIPIELSQVQLHRQQDEGRLHKRTKAPLSPLSAIGGDNLLEKNPRNNSADSSDDKTTSRDNPFQGVQFFSRARTDRSGAAVLDMLLCHAFAFQEQVVYGGACAEETKDNQVDKFAESPLQQLSSQQIVERTRLIQILGLQAELPFVCPTDRSGIMMNRDDYFSQDTAIFTSPWLEKMRSKVVTSPVHKRRSKQRPHHPPLQVAVHVRRGDVTPCTEPDRYLPNAYYLALLSQYISNTDANVTIYSETKSFEKWEDFTHRGYSLALDTPVENVWEALIEADVLILSKSSFSFVPALFNLNMIVYTPFWHKPLDGWTVVPQDLVDLHFQNFSRKVDVLCTEVKPRW